MQKNKKENNKHITQQKGDLRMFRFLNQLFGRENDQKQQRNNQQGQNKNQVEELMNEVGRELGVNENTRSTNQDPKQLAERMKEEIKKRK
jgi:hypothetical protein